MKTNSLLYVTNDYIQLQRRLPTDCFHLYLTQLLLFISQMFLIEHCMSTFIIISDLFFNSFNHSGDSYSTSSRDNYSEALPTQSWTKKKDLISFLNMYHLVIDHVSCLHQFISTVSRHFIVTYHLILHPRFIV